MSIPVNSANSQQAEVVEDGQMHTDSEQRNSDMQIPNSIQSIESDDSESKTSNDIEIQPAVNTSRLGWLKVKYLTGMTVASANPRFGIVNAQLIETAKFAKKTHRDCKKYQAWLKVSPQLAVTADFNSYFSKDDCNELETAAALADFHQLSAKAQDSSSIAHDDYAEQVLGCIDQWLLQYKTLQPRIEKMHQWHLVHDHYNNKLAGLQAALAKDEAQYKDTPQQKERLQRNIAKLDKAKAGYDQANEQLITDMNEMYNTRFTAFAPAALGFVHFHQERNEVMCKRG